MSGLSSCVTAPPNPPLPTIWKQPDDPVEVLQTGTHLSRAAALELAERIKAKLKRKYPFLHDDFEFSSMSYDDGKLTVDVTEGMFSTCSVVVFKFCGEWRVGHVDCLYEK